MPKKKHPHQPLVKDGKIKRFKVNKLVRYLYDYASQKGCDMNNLALLPFSNEDRVQFAQLIGYSLNGFGELPYVSDKVWFEVNK
jgi:hypothetical protein